MNVAGVIPILAPPQAVDAALHDPKILQRMLPACEAVDHLGPGQFRGHLARKVGLLTLRIEPDIRLVPLADGTGFDLSVDASSRIAGSFAARLRLTIRREPLGTRMFWEGTVTTTGLAQRLLAERQDQIDARVTALFNTLKAALEGG